MRRWVCLDVGETLVDETRVWSAWADVLGIPRLTFMAALGAVLERGGDYRDVFEVVGRSDWRRHFGEMEQRYGAFRADDLYPDALPAIAALRELGYRARHGRQPAGRRGAPSCGPSASTSSHGHERGAGRGQARCRLLRPHPRPAGLARAGRRGLCRRPHRQRRPTGGGGRAAGRSGCGAGRGASSRPACRPRRSWWSTTSRSWCERIDALLAVSWRGRPARDVGHLTAAMSYADRHHA